MPDDKKDPFGADFDPMAGDSSDFAPRKPRPARKSTSSPLDDEIGFEAGGQPVKPKTNDFWASARTTNKPGAPKKNSEAGFEADDNIGTGAPSKNAFIRNREAVKPEGDTVERDRIRRMAEDVFGDEGQDAPNIPLDTPVSNGYWGAMWAFTSLRDVEVVVDAPVGCYSLPATAIVNYTEALPELENLASSNITEIEVTLDGTTRKVLDAVRRVKQREAEKGSKKYLIVVSSQESELIGADHNVTLLRKHPDAIYFTSHAFEEDEWKARDSSLLWLYEERYRRNDFQVTPDKKLGKRVNIIGPTYGCFNSYADLHELKRLITGAGGELHYVFPFEANYGDMHKLEESAVNVVMYREFGSSLAKKLDKPMLYAPFGMHETTEFIRELGELLGTSEQAEAFIKQEKRETLLPIWDIWLGAPQDFFSTCSVAIIANESYTLGIKRFLGDELGLPIKFVVNRQKSNDTNQWLLRNKIARERPTFVMGSMNERIYIAEAGVPSRFIPASLPLPMITRSVGTPYMGYRGAMYLAQIITNHIFEVLFDVLPRERRTPGANGTPAQNQHGHAAPGQPSNGSKPANGQSSEKFSANLDALSGDIKWSPEAKAIFDQLLEKVPWVARISASDKLRQVAIAETRAADQAVVTPEFVMKALPKVMM